MELPRNFQQEGIFFRAGFLKMQYWNRPKHDFSSQNYCKDCMSKWFNFDELIKYWAYLVKLEGIEALIFNFQDFEKLILVKEDYWSPLIRCRPFIPSKMMNLVNIILHIIYNVQPLRHFSLFFYHKYAEFQHGRNFGASKLILSETPWNHLQSPKNRFWVQLSTFNLIMNIQITVLEKLRSLSLSDYDGYIVSIKGEELCSNSFCVLGIHTKCIEDLNDFKPQCVSPCKTGRI